MPIQPEIVELSPQPAAVITTKTAVNGISEALGRIYGLLPGWLQRAGVPIVGPPFVLYGGMDDAGWTLTAGFPVAEPIAGEGEVQPGETPGGRALRVIHAGPYETIGGAWRELEAWMREHGHELGGAAWESYLSDPDAEPDPARWQTALFWHIP